MKKKSFMTLLLAASLCITVLAGCGSKSAGTSASPDASAKASGGGEKKTFTVGFDASFPPYGFKDDSGEYVGFDLDLAGEVCKREGWELVKKPIDWDSKDMELSSGTIDCIWNGFTINGREDQYTFTEPYVNNTQVFVVRADSDIKTAADLSGKTVLVQADSSALAALQDEAKPDNIALAKTFKKLTQVPDYLTAFMSLDSGAADTIAMDVGVAEYQISKRGREYTILDTTLASEQYGVGFKLGNTELRDEVQTQLDAMVKDGTFMTIAKKWGLEDAVSLGK